MRSTLLAGINPRGQYGNALLVKGTITDVNTVTLHDDYLRLNLGSRPRNLIREPRNAIIANTKIAGRAITVAATHLGGPARKQQLNDAMAALSSRPQPHILLGDFNTERTDMRTWLEPFTMTLAETPAEYRTPNTGRQVDHIAANGLTIVSVKARYFPISDHPAVIADLHLPVC